MAVPHCTTFTDKRAKLCYDFQSFRLTWWPFILLQWRSLCCLRHVCATEFILGIWNYWPHSPISIQLCSKDYSSTSQFESEFLLDSDYSRRWSPSKYFSSGAYLPYVDLLHERATSCTQSVILTSQERPKNGLRSDILALIYWNLLRGAWPPPRDYVDFRHIIACCGLQSNYPG